MKDRTKAFESQIRRFAKRVGLAAHKSRKKLSPDNHGGFMLVDPNNVVVAGSKYELSPEEAFDYLDEFELEEFINCTVQ